jgi:glycosyltransferase involved in cell wall biosynthesis
MGGGTTFVLNLAAALKEHRFESTIISQTGSALLEQARATGFPVVGIDFGSRIRSPMAAWALRDALRRLGPDLVHVHGLRAALPVTLSAEWMRLPVTYTVHGLHFHYKTGPSHGLGRISEALCFASFSDTVFVSEGDRLHAEHEGILGWARRYSVICNAIPPVEMPHRPSDKQYDIVFLGRLERQKNPLVLADILAGLRPLKGRLCIIGGGSLESALRNRIGALGLSEQVIWLGPLHHQAALREAARARLLLLPSLWEGHPLSVIEAMQLELPVVASDVAGTREIVIDGQTGYLVGTNDIASYVAKIRGLLLDEGLRRRMGQAGADRIRNVFSFAEHIRRYVEVYDRQLISRRATFPVLKVAGGGRPL